MATQNVDIKKLLEAGAHFGHKTSRWHPKMAPFIHSKRGGTHIIDLVQTVDHLNKALAFIESTAAEGKQVLLVGTKKQAQAIVKKAAEDTEMPFVTERWLGGMLTNRTTMNSRIKHLKDLESKMESGQLESRYNKLEVQRFQEEIDQLNHIFGGVKHMMARPGAVFIIDIINDVNALREARKLSIPTVALVDTNADPTDVDYVVPSNDDAIKTIQLVMDHVVAAIQAGKDAYAKKSEKAAAAKEEAPKAE